MTQQEFAKQYIKVNMPAFVRNAFSDKLLYGTTFRSYINKVKDNERTLFRQCDPEELGEAIRQGIKEVLKSYETFNKLLTDERKATLSPVYKNNRELAEWYWGNNNLTEIYLQLKNELEDERL